jgi:uncharacterized protein YgiM (DUF1202 family)
LRVYGDDDLLVVEEAPDPAPIATLLAQAAEPVVVLDDLLAQLGATATAVAQQPPTATVAPLAILVTPVPASLLATPTPGTSESAADVAVTAAGSSPGVVSSEGRLNLRSEPGTAATIVRKLEPGEAVTIVERSADGLWLRVQLADGVAGWVAAEYISPQ